MTSEPRPAEAYAWIWLPEATEPVVAGRLRAEGDLVTFTYGRSYLGRADAIPLCLPELPLARGAQRPLDGLPIAGCIADAAPDAWGQRVIMRRLIGADARDVDPAVLTDITYLLESGSDRIGALDFQESATEYVPRDGGAASLDELARAAERVERGIPFSPALDQALLRGSSIGGARPKALLRGEEGGAIAKFSSSTDRYSVVKAEFVAMELARRVGLDVAPVRLTEALDKDVLLVERFDRVPGTRRRRALVSALTMLGLGELTGRYASYADLAQLVRARFTDARRTLHELFGRIVFNVLSGNTDDHARNHAAFWDGRALTLTPAYDICPQARVGGETRQAMAFSPSGDSLSQLVRCVAAASTYLLDETGAREIVDRQLETIESEWSDVCDLARLTEVERAYFWGRQFLNPYALEGYEQRS